MHSRICKTCKKELSTKDKRRYYCSAICKEIGSRNIIKKAIYKWRKRNKERYNNYMRLYMQEYKEKYKNRTIGTFYFKKREDDKKELEYIHYLKKKILKEN